MNHCTAGTMRSDLERLRAASEAMDEGRYTCLACLDTGLLYVHREPYGRHALGIVPCTECDAGAERHVGRDGSCLWAHGIHPCALCGAHEGEMIPSGWKPEPPAGWVPYHELPGWKGTD